MAWLEQEKTGIYQICFRYQGERFKKSARTRDERKAQALQGRVEENIELVERPAACSGRCRPIRISDFRRADKRRKVEAAKAAKTLRAFCPLPGKPSRRCPGS